MIRRTIDVHLTAREMGAEWASAGAVEQVDMLVAAAQTMRSWEAYHRDRQLLAIAEQLREAPIALTLMRDLMACVDDESHRVQGEARRDRAHADHREDVPDKT